MTTLVARSFPPAGEDIAFAKTANGLALVIVDAADAGAGEAAPAATTATQVAAPAADTLLVAAKTNRSFGFLMYDGTGELRLTLNGRVSTLSDYDVSLFKGDILDLNGRTLAIKGIDVTPNGFVHLYEELTS